MINNKYFGCGYEEYIQKSQQSKSSQFCIPSNKEYYHYASVDAVKSILQHKNQAYTMWASHLSFLNDWEEFENGEKLIFEELETFINMVLAGSTKEKDLSFVRIVQEFIKAAQRADRDISVNNEIIFNRNIFILCFCQEKNSLSQWKYYGKESGIALEFNLEGCEYGGLDCKYPDKFVSQTPYKVIYDDKEKRKILKDLINEMYQEFSNQNDDEERRLLQALADIYSLCPLFKHEDFKDEKECRLLFRPLYSDKEKDVRSLVKYRKRNNILLPYMEIRMHRDHESKTREPMIKNIIIGPGENQELIYKSMRHFALYTGVFDEYLEESGGGNIQEIVDEHILKSSTPFRG